HPAVLISPTMSLPSILSEALHHPPLFFFTAPAPPETYTLSLHDALPISGRRRWPVPQRMPDERRGHAVVAEERFLERQDHREARSEEHTSELQSRFDLVCRLLLEKKKKKIIKMSRLTSV